MRRETARQGLVEFVYTVVEAWRIGEPVALADVRAEHFAKTLAGFMIDFGWFAFGFPELGELAGFAEVKQMTPDFLARRAGLAEVAGIRGVKGFELGRVRKI